MNNADLVNLLVTGLLSGGLVGGAAALITSRSMSRKTHAEAATIAERAPAERDNIVVQGAEAAVLTMQRALDAREAEITQLRADRESDRTRIAELETRLETVEARMRTAEDALAEARIAGAELRTELASLRQSRPRRP